MDVQLFQTKTDLGKAAAATGAKAIRAAIEAQGRANIVVATGASQFEILEALVQRSDASTGRRSPASTSMNISGCRDTHPASFRRYLRERFTSKLPTLGAFHFIDGDAAGSRSRNSSACQMPSWRIPIDVTFAGIGENGHLAFNDPPADFDTDEALHRRVARREMPSAAIRRRLVPDLRRMCRETAISMSVRQIMKSKLLVLSVPDARKADAVREALEGPVTNMCPASIVQQHPACRIFLDPDPASKLSEAFRAGISAR